MTQKIIKYYIVLLVIFFSWVGIVHADVVINEVQIKPTGESFIELYNNGDTQNLTGWSIKRKTSSGTDNSLVSASRLKDKSIEAGSYFILTNEGSYTGSANSDATWAKSYNLANDNAVSLYNSSSIDPISTVGWGKANHYCDSTCPSNPAEGLSIQKNLNGDWVISSPTLGYINSELEDTSENPPSDTNNDTSDISSSTSSTSTSSTTTEVPVILKITTKIISPKIVVAGIPFSLSSLTTTNRGETYAVGKFVWNFGDGGKGEVGKSSPFDYIYEYPGEYALTLSYFNNSFNEIADATDRIIIKVIPSDVYISSVGNDSDPYIELENKSNYEIVLSNWIITAGVHYFVIPEGTTLLQGKKIKLSPKITGFVGEDIKYVVITNPNKEIIATYPIETKKLVSKNSSVNNNTTFSNPVLPNNNPQNSPSLKDPQIINLNDLGASAEESGISAPSGAYTFIGLLVIILLGITSFLFIKKKNKTKDYIEDEIRPEDMTIIE